MAADIDRSGIDRSGIDLSDIDRSGIDLSDNAFWSLPYDRRMAAYFCLGAHLARTEMTALLRELSLRAPTIRSVGEPDRLTSSFAHPSPTTARYGDAARRSHIDGIKRLRYEMG